MPIKIISNCTCVLHAHWTVFSTSSIQQPVPLFMIISLWQLWWNKPKLAQQTGLDSDVKETPVALIRDKQKSVQIHRKMAGNNPRSSTEIIKCSQHLMQMQAVEQMQNHSKEWNAMKKGWTERKLRGLSQDRGRDAVIGKGQRLVKSWVAPAAASRGGTHWEPGQTQHTPSWENHCFPWIYRWIRLTSLFTFVSAHVFVFPSIPESHVPPSLCLLHHLLLALQPPWLCRLGA